MSGAGAAGAAGSRGSHPPHLTRVCVCVRTAEGQPGSSGGVLPICRDCGSELLARGGSAGSVRVSYIRAARRAERPRARQSPGWEKPGAL